jgi:hypothetical protein
MRRWRGLTVSGWPMPAATAQCQRNAGAARRFLDRITATLAAAAALGGCTGPPAAVPGDRTSEPLTALPTSAMTSAYLPFEQQQRERAVTLAQQGRLAEAALAWEVLTMLAPGNMEYVRRLDDANRQIDAGINERLQLAAQAQQRGATDAAAQHYLSVLALRSGHAQAAEALRAIERDRNKRNYLGKPSRLTLTRQAIADGEMQLPLAQRNELEHAALLASQGEFDDAAALLERRLAVNRRDGAARALLADVYFDEAQALAPRNRPAAISAVRRSLQLDPADERARALLKELLGGAAAPAADNKLPAPQR